MVKRNGLKNKSLFAGSRHWIAACLAVMMAGASVSVAAQTAFEFEDPLDDVRAQIEQRTGNTAEGSDATPSAVQSASDWTAATATSADNAFDRASDAVKARASALGEQTGLSLNTILGIGLAALLALAAGLYWLLTRRKPAPRRTAKARDLYAVENGARGRRSLDSGAKVTRARKKALDTTEAGAVASGGAAAAAAKIISDEPVDAVAAAYDDYPDTEEPMAHASDEAEADARDPSTWKRPNLDRLKASIRDDWKAESATAAEPAANEQRSDAETFAELFGDDDGQAMRAEAKTPVLDMLDTFDAPRDDMPISALREAVATQASGAAERVAERPDLPSRNDAVRRVKALRDSLRAS